MILKKLDIILGEDMERTLAKIGELEKVKRGELFCEYCGVPITLENIQIIVPLPQGGFRYVCHQVECVNQFARGER